MSVLTLRWRKPAPAIVTQWRGPGATIVRAEAAAPAPAAAVIGPPGVAGPVGPAGPPGDVAAAVIDGGTFF